jgi:hypothetical protein
LVLSILLVIRQLRNRYKDITETIQYGAVGRVFGGSHLLMKTDDVEAGEEGGGVLGRAFAGGKGGERLVDGSRGPNRRQLEGIAGDQDGQISEQAAVAVWNQRLKLVFQFAEEGRLQVGNFVDDQKAQPIGVVLSPKFSKSGVAGGWQKLVRFGLGTRRPENCGRPGRPVNWRW